MSEDSMSMKTPKAVPAYTPEAKKARDRVVHAEETGWNAFLALMLAGRDATSLDIKRALLGLGREISVLRESVKSSLDAASVVASLHQKQNLALMVRQEILHGHLKRVEAWAVLPWFQRRKTMRPTLPDLPPIASSEEIAKLLEDVAEKLGKGDDADV